MKQKPFSFRQIEWWFITIIFLAIVLSNILSVNIDYLTRGNDLRMNRYIANIFLPLILYGAFYFVHMKIIPQYLLDRKKSKLIIYSLLVFFVSLALSMPFYFGANYGDHPFMPFYFSAVAIYLSYLLLVYIFKRLILDHSPKDYSFYNIIRLITLYLFTMLFLLKMQKYYWDLLLVVYMIVLPAILAVSIYNFLLVYQYEKSGRNGEARAYYWLLPALVAIIFIVIGIGGRSLEPLIAGAICILLMMLVVLPLSNLLFRKYDDFLGQISTLSLQVDQGAANLDFLRSQINPHFLFNALNTLYGTALQETAERTGEGIQKLGDMMRFMLHENHQDTIPVEREREYLLNYVDLQLLRLQDQENIDITFLPGETPCSGMIAPMLLVPFVENAFKHGISFRKKSWIKISLRCLEGSVHLDVNNSIHRKDADDPEYKASGIGLENVRQRLKLLYGDRNELVVRENEMEFFVHLSIKLK
ncbi:histidine kinase [Litoribacter alkaliphilus]|uniref:Histidine kinase n=1 Tax=Litoribacter ruber TaxID=702568 RepID=A0AAP2CLD9_9BACT|nr:histidine kinase [Litoribacter alkaliphilus]MBS9524730.1 histidine kinase [Litoribacter alkaliphilus]